MQNVQGVEEIEALRQLERATEAEKQQLESRLRHVIHNQEGQLNQQKLKISKLQTALNDELSVSQNRIAELESENKWLKK